MIKRKVWKLISIAMALFCIINGIHSIIEYNKIEEEYKLLYEKRHLTVEDLKTGSSYKYSSTIMPNEESATSPTAVSYKKLYGVEHIGKYEINENQGIEVSFWHGDPAKTLILDKDGNEVFYEEATEIGFEPGKAGKYDVYIVGNKFTGKVEIRTYQCE